MGTKSIRKTTEYQDIGIMLYKLGIIGSVYSTVNFLTCSPILTK